MQSNTEQRKVDVYYNEYNAVYQRMSLGAVAYISVPLIMFGLLAVVWAIPFPDIAFLGKYKGYINWASFLIAAGIYYYLRLSPLISYLLLLLLFGYSYIIIAIEQGQKEGGAPLLAVGAIVFFIGLLGQLLVLNQAVALRKWRLILISFVWAAVSTFKRFKLKY